MNFVTYWFSDKIILRMFGASPADDAEAPQLYEMVRVIPLGLGILAIEFEWARQLLRKVKDKWQRRSNEMRF